MHTKTFNDMLNSFLAIYPDERLCNGVSYCTRKRGYGRKFLKYHEKAYLYYNMQMIWDTDMYRAWLYVDLAGKTKTLSQCKNWFKAYLSVDFKSWQTANDAVYELIRRENIPSFTISEFKARIKNETGFTGSFLLAPVWSQVEDFLCSQMSDRDLRTWLDLVQKIVQWTRTGRKLRLINTDAEEAAYEKFKLNDDRLRSLWSEPSDERDSVLKDLRKIISSWLSPFEFKVDFPHHGSGATSNELTKKNITRKVMDLAATDEWLAWLYRKLQLVNPFEDLKIPSAIRPEDKELLRWARWLTVDKNIDERRGIGPQAAALMWIQQGVRDWFYSVVFKSPFFRKHMPIFDRTVNQEAAKRGSKHNTLATVDLSSASDSVSVHLVKQLFEGPLRLALLLARSTCFDKEPDRKFTTYATMGDATTFPVETIVISACVYLAITKAVEKYRSCWVKLPFDPDDWSVFGDDIVIPNDAVVMAELYRILTLVGFKVNYDKSFVHGPYRESCGVEAYLGHEIQPHYMRCKVDDVGARFASLISLANAMYWRGYKTSRQWFIYCLREIGEIPFTEVADDNSRVYTPFLRMETQSVIWDKDVQEIKVVSHGVRSPLADKSASAFNDAYAYYVHMAKKNDTSGCLGKGTSKRLLDLNYTLAHGFIGYLMELEKTPESEPDYDERTVKLCRTAVPVRLLVRAYK